MSDTQEEDWEISISVTVEESLSLFEKATTTFVKTLHYFILTCLAFVAVAYLFF